MYQSYDIKRNIPNNVDGVGQCNAKSKNNNNK